MTARELIGVKVKPGVRRSVLDVLMRRGQLGPGHVAYSVSDCGPPAGATPAAKPPQEKRLGSRRRTRLRSGKILDKASRFVMDAAIVDRSTDGLRLRLASDEAIPQQFLLFDDETETAHPAQVIWRRQELVGARLAKAAPACLTPRQIAALRKYYAIKD